MDITTKIMTGMTVQATSINELCVVVEGFLKDKNYFLATKILAKHDENYMPPEVKEAIGDK